MRRTLPRHVAMAVCLADASERCPASSDAPILDGVEPKLVWIARAGLPPALFRSTGCDSLDDWLAHTGVPPAAGHDVVGDAFVTAQVALVTRDAAGRVGMRTSGDLVAMHKARARLGTTR